MKFLHCGLINLPGRWWGHCCITELVWGQRTGLRIWCWMIFVILGITKFRNVRRRSSTAIIVGMIFETRGARWPPRRFLPTVFPPPTVTPTRIEPPKAPRASGPEPHGVGGHANVLVLVLFGLFPFVTKPIVILHEFNHVRYFVPNIHSLIFAWKKVKCITKVPKKQWRNLLLFDKNFVKAMHLQKKLLKSWFDEFFGESTYIQCLTSSPANFTKEKFI